jgi:hypothetical protein
MKTGWRKIGRDRLPRMNEPVWMLLESEGIVTGCRAVDGEHWYWGRCYDQTFFNSATWRWEKYCADMDDYKPTHWHPFPKPPGRKKP